MDLAIQHRVDNLKRGSPKGIRRSNFRLVPHGTFSTPAHDECGIRRHVDRGGKPYPRVDLLRGSLIGCSVLESLQGSGSL